MLFQLLACARHSGGGCSAPTMCAQTMCTKLWGRRWHCTRLAHASWCVCLRRPGRSPAVLAVPFLRAGSSPGLVACSPVSLQGGIQFKWSQLSPSNCSRCVRAGHGKPCWQVVGPLPRAPGSAAGLRTSSASHRPRCGGCPWVRLPSTPDACNMLCQTSQICSC